MKTKHPTYNRTNYPHFVCHNGNWDIYANDLGFCAAIPTEKKSNDGCIATHFGDRHYASATLGNEAKEAIENIIARAAGGKA